MDRIIIEPISKIAVPGTEVEFKARVQAEGASSIHLIPCQEAKDYDVGFIDGALSASAVTEPISFHITAPAKAGMA